jgi:hypothetical protein
VSLVAALDSAQPTTPIIKYEAPLILEPRLYPAR